MLKFWKIPPRRLDHRKIYYLSDVLEENILEKIREEFRSEIELMKSGMIVEIVSALGGLPRHVVTKGSYDEFVEDFDITRSSGDDIIDHMERPIGTRASQLARLGS